MATWYSIVYDNAIAPLKKGLVRLKAFSCFGMIGERCYDEFMEDSDAHIIVGLAVNIARSANFIKDFNSKFKNVQIVTHLEEPNENPSRYVELVFAPQYRKKAQWCMIVPIMEMLRDFDEGYGRLGFLKEDTLANLIQTISSVAEARQRGGGSVMNLYGAWSVEPVTIEEVMMMDDPHFMNKVCEENFDYIACRPATSGFPYGTRLSKAIKDELIGKKVMPAFDETWDFDNEYDDDDDPWDE